VASCICSLRNPDRSSCADMPLGGKRADHV
jgi:hypothetical protein